MKPKAGLLSLPEELHSYILSFLSCQDILRCTSVCKALHRTYTSSSELQYIVELSGQQLLPVPGANDHSPISKRLQLLRDKAHAWFKFNTCSSETVSLPEADGLHPVDIFVTDGHIRLWDRDNNSAEIIPILPKPSQRKIRRHWCPGTLCPVPDSIVRNILMDPAQNLFAVVYAISDGPFPLDKILYIDLGALNSDCNHPQAAGRTLFLQRLPGYHIIAELKGFERHIALLRWQCVAPVVPGTSSDSMLHLQIWDWQRSTASNCILSDMCLDIRSYIDCCFLGNDRLLLVTDCLLKLYSIEDMSQTPQLLACFLMPVQSKNVDCLVIQHSSEPHMQAQQTIYTSDPKHRLLCITNGLSSPNRLFIISTKIFFDLGGMAAATPIPWKCWGPPNTRIFEHMDEFRVNVCGNRVLQAFPVNEPDSVHREFILHVMDFSPLAVTNRRGLGRVVKESSTIDIEESGESVTTSLPYVEVVLDTKFGSDLWQLDEIWMDKDRVYLLKGIWDGENIVPQCSWLEVIDI